VTRSEGLDWRHAVLSRLNRADSADTLRIALIAVLENTRELLGLSHAAIRIYSGSGKSDLELDLAPDGAALCFAGLDAPGCVCGGALDAGTAVLTNKIPDGDCAAAGYRTVFVAPITCQDVRLGVLLAASWESVEPERDAVEALEMVLDEIGAAAVRVRYRDHWFYIPDEDLASKSTFSLLAQLFALQAGSGDGLRPVLTLPVGG